MGDLFNTIGGADGRRLAETLLERCELRDRHRAQVLNLVGQLSLGHDTERARRAVEEASVLSAELGERTLEGWARFYQGLAETVGTLVDPARGHLETARALLADLEDLRGWALATATLGLAYIQMDELSRARELVEEAQAANIAAGYEFGRGQCEIYLGIITERTGGEPALATRHYRTAVEHLRPFRGGPLLPFALAFQAGVLGRRDPARSLRVLAAAYALRERTGTGFAPFVRARAEALREEAETALGTDAEAAWAEGARLELDDAIALAFATDLPGERSST
jgi:tetratricopeptide (TPR) repeat protein